MYYTCTYSYPTRFLAFHSILSSFVKYTLHVSILLNYALDCSIYLLLNCGVGWRVEERRHRT